MGAVAATAAAVDEPVPIHEFAPGKLDGLIIFTCFGTSDDIPHVSNIGKVV